MAKKRLKNLGINSNPVTSNMSGEERENASLLQGSSLYKENAGATDVGGRGKNAQYATDYFNNKLLGIGIGETTTGYSKMGSDSFNPFSNQNDYEKIRKDTQSLPVASANMLGSFVAKTALNTVGGVIGSFYGIGSAIGNQDMSKLIDNSFMRGVDHASEKVDEYAPVFTSQTDKNNGLFGMFSGLETTKSVSDAFAFTAGAILTELSMQSIGNVVTGGAAEAALPSRIARYTSGIMRSFSESNAVGRNLARAGDYIGVGDRLRRVGQDAELVSAFIRNADTPEGIRLMQRAAMTEGMGMDALRRYSEVSRGFEMAGSGLRKVLTGSMYEGSLEGRQAYDAMMMNAEISIDAQMNSEGIPMSQRSEEKAKRLQAADADAKKLMFGVMATNVALLSVSNAIQFPTLFGLKSFDPVKNLNSMSSRFTRDAISGAVNRVALTGGKAAIAKTAKALESPFTEFMEETLQGVISKTSQNFHDRLTNARSQTAGMESPIADFTKSLSEAFVQEYGSKEGIEEGVIGAIVGGIGAPTFRRNSKGKIRPAMVGGIMESFRGPSALEKAHEQDALDVLNSDSQLNSLRYNLEQSKLNSLSTNEKDKAARTNNDNEFDSLSTDEIFQHVSNYLDKGLQDHLMSEREALTSMTDEEYTLRTRGEGQTTISPEVRKQELDDYFRKVDNYTQAYESVFKNMKMDKMNDNPLNQRLLTHLAYALAKDKEELLSFDNQVNILRKKGLTITNREAYALAKSHSYLNRMTEKEIEDELASYRSTEDPAYTSFIDELTNAEFGKRSQRDSTREKEILDQIKADYGLSYSTLSNKVKRELAERARKDYGENNVVNRMATMQNYRNEFDADARFDKELRKKIEDFNRKNNPYDSEKSYESRKSDLENSQEDIWKTNTRNNIEAARKFQKTQSQAMTYLAGSQPRITVSDIQEYNELLAKYKGQLLQDETVPQSFMDQLESKGTKDINEMLDDLAQTVERRETSLRVAAHLYGLTGVEGALRNIAKAELITNYNNNQFYRKALKHFMQNGALDDSGAEAAIAYNKLDLSTKAMQESVENLRNANIENESDELSELLSALNNEIDLSLELMQEYREEIGAADAQEEANEEMNKELNANNSTSIQEKIEDQVIEASESEVQEAMLTNNLVLQHGEFVSETKGSLDLYSSFDENKQMRDAGLRELINKGEVGINSVVYLRPIQNLSLPESTRSAMSQKQQDLYDRGAELFAQDSSIIGNDAIMDVSQFMVDNELIFDDSDNAAIQFFAMTFVVDKEITNDTAVSGEEGEKLISRKKEENRINAVSRLYSPYFAFDKTGEQAKVFNKILQNDIKKLEAYERAMNDNSNTEIERLHYKKEFDLLNISVTARKLRANDATLYLIRKQILFGLTLHKAQGKTIDYTMNTLVRDFNYGPISEHTEDGMPKDTGDYNNFPVLNIGEINSGNFDANDNFLFDKTSAKELFDDNKIAIAFQDSKLVYLNTGQNVSFADNTSSSSSEIDVDTDQEKGTELEERKKYSTGSLYYMHETSTGVIVPVKLNAQEIKSNEDVMNGIRKHLQTAIEAIKLRESDTGQTFRLSNEDISIDPGDFAGMFDNDLNKPTKIHDLLEYFLPHYKGAKDITLPLMVNKIGIKGDSKNAVSEDTDSENPALNQSESNVKLFLDFGTPNVTIADMNDFALEEIMNNIGSMRFYMKKELSVDKSKAQDERLIRPDVFNFVFSSGLVTHGFETNFNVEKIYSPINKQTVMSTDEYGREVFVSDYQERQVGMSIAPIENSEIEKAKRVLENQYANETRPRLHDEFRKAFGMNKNNVLSLIGIYSRVYNQVEQDFSKLELRGSNVNIYNEYIKAAEVRVKQIRLDLSRMKERFSSPKAQRLIDLASSQVDKYVRAITDPANKSKVIKMIQEKSNPEAWKNRSEVLDLLRPDNSLNVEFMDTISNIDIDSALADYQDMISSQQEDVNTKKQNKPNDMISNLFSEEVNKPAEKAIETITGRGRGNQRQTQSMIDNLISDDNLTEEELAFDFISKQRKNSDKVAWLVRDRIPQDESDLDKYHPEEIFKNFWLDRKDFVKQDFEAMSDEDFIEYFNNKTGESTAKDLMRSAINEDLALTKQAFNELAKREKRTMPKEKVNVENILGQEDEAEEQQAETIELNSKVDKVNTNNTSSLIDYFSESRKKQLKRVVMTKNENTLSSIINEVRLNNEGADNLNNDIFVSAADVVANTEGSKLPNNESMHFLAKVLFGDSYSKESTDSIINEYNNNCKA